MSIRPSILMLALLASGCASLPASGPSANTSPTSTTVQPAADAAPQEAATAEATAASKVAATEAAATPDAPPLQQTVAQALATPEKPKANAKRPATSARLYPGTDTLFKADVAPKADPVLARGDKVSLNFENANVGSLAQALLGDLLKLNYTVDAGADTVVSLHTRQPLLRSQVLDVLDAVLLPHDLAIVRDNAGVYHVTKRAVTVGSRPVVGAGRFKDLSGAGTVIVPLNYIAAGEMAKILAPIAPREAIVYVDTLRNLLVLQGSKGQLSGWLELVDAFDVDFLSGMSLGVFVLENANVNVVRDALQAMLSPDKSADTSVYPGNAASSGGSSAGSSGAVGAGSVSGSGTSAAALSGNPLQGLIRVFPVERLNALVVVTPRSHLLAQVEKWIRRLDQPSDALEAGLFVYPVQNGSALHLAEMLNGLFGSDTNRTQAGVAAGSAPSQFTRAPAASTSTATAGPSGALATKTSGASSFGAPAMPALGGTGTGNNAPLTSVSQLDGNIRVVADEKRNALLIRAPRVEYRRIEQALRELDKAPAQVLIEASIVEVSLTGNLEYGVEWFVQNNLGSRYNGEALLNMNKSGGIGARQPGFSYTLLNKAGVIRATLNALAEKSQLRVLSNPSVLVLDNHNATIQIGQQQPVKSATTVTSGDLVTESITYKDTGVMLSVTPSVNAGGLITMDIVQQVTDVGEIDAATGQRNFLTRQIQSRVAVRSGEPIVLGGMIRENETRGRSGVPGFSDIPLLGSLFSTTSDSRVRTELLVLLTPRALEDDDELRAASVEMRQRMRAMELQRSSGNVTIDDVPTELGR